MKFKTLILAVIGICAAIGMIALADTPSYVTKSGAGNATTPAEVIFVSDPVGQIRLVNLTYQSDSNTAVVSFSSGAGAYTLTQTNGAGSSGTTQIVASTTGLVTNNVLVLEHAGVGYAATLSSTNNGTNAVLASGGFGVAPSAGDNVYQMNTASTVFVGSNGTATAAMNGEALYVGNRGRPVRAQLTPSLVTNRLNTVVGRYE